MSNINKRGFILFSVILLIILLFFIGYKRENSLPTVYPSKNISNSSSFKSYTRGLPIISTDNGQLFTFPDESPLVRLYLDIVRDTVCGLTLRTQEKSVVPHPEAFKIPFNLEKRLVGQDWALIGITMIGQKRLINVEWSLRFVIANNVPGDFIECGVWRGGSALFARAVLKVFDVTDRHIWLADSFEGLPQARTSNDIDDWSKQTYLRVPLEEVQTNFRSFYLLDDQVHFCKGFFVDSLPQCNVSRIAVLRMDGDMYESTMDQLFNLYAKISIGGVIIVDDYPIAPCNRAIHDFRNWHGITEKIMEVPGDRDGVYWIKKNMIQLQMDRYKPLLVSKEKTTG